MPKTTKSSKSEQAADQLDGLLGTREVEVVTGYTRRWLFTLIKSGKFPKPDVPGHLGAANKWRRSTIRAYLDGVTNRDAVAAAPKSFAELSPAEAVKQIAAWRAGGATEQLLVELSGWDLEGVQRALTSQSKAAPAR